MINIERELDRSLDLAEQLSEVMRDADVSYGEAMFACLNIIGNIAVEFSDRYGKNETKDTFMRIFKGVLKIYLRDDKKE